MAEPVAQTCAGRCGGVANACGTAVDCGACACAAACPACQTCDVTTGQCVPNAALTGQACGDGQICQAAGVCACDAVSCGACRSCQGSGACSAICDGTGCCDGMVCQSGRADTACSAGIACVACGGTTPHCLGQTCKPCTGLSCPFGQLCDGGACLPCDVCPSAGGCPYASIQNAVSDASGPATIRICPETYHESIVIDRDIELVGSGDRIGDGDTLLHGGNANTVITINPGWTVSLRKLRITGGAASIGDRSGGGILNFQAASLTVADCTIAGNTAFGGGGGISNNLSGAGSDDRTVRTTRCTILNNSATGTPPMFPTGSSGGGILQSGGQSASSHSMSYRRQLIQWQRRGHRQRRPDLPGRHRGERQHRRRQRRRHSQCGQIHSGPVGRATGNIAGAPGGGIFNTNGHPVTLANGSTVSGNTPDDCVGTGPSGAGGCAAP